MGLGIGSWALLGDSEFTGGTVGDLWVNGNLTANTYYSGATPLWDIITDYISPETTGYTFDSIGLAVTDETTAISSGSSKVTIRMPYDFLLTGVTAYLVTTGSTSTIVDVNYNGSTVFNSPITISSGSYYTVTTDLVSSQTALTEHSTVSVDIDSAGTNAAGLKIWLEGLRLQTAMGSSNTGDGDITRVQPGINTFTGGTDNLPTVNITGGTFDSLTVTGSTTLGTVSVDVLSATTIYSGGTPLEQMITQIASGGGTGTTGQFMAIYTAGTHSWTAPVGVYAVTVELWGGGGGGGGGGQNTTSSTIRGGGGGSAGAYVLGQVSVVPGASYNIRVGSGGTGGYDIESTTGPSASSGESSYFGTLLAASGGTAGGNAQIANGAGTGSGGAAVYLAGYNGTNIVNTPSFIFVKGYDGLDGPGVPATSDTSGGNGGDAPIFSRNKYNGENGGTGGNTPNTSVSQLGGNASGIGGGGAGGTGYFSSSPKIGYSGGTGSKGMVILRWNAGSGTTYQYNEVFSGGTISGNTNVDATLSANTYYSGGTSFETILSRYAYSSHTHVISDVTNLLGSLNTKANLSGATFTGGIIAPSLSATTLSGGTIYSGGTGLYSIFQPKGANTVVAAGTNTQTGGTFYNETISTVDSPSFNNISFSGTAIGGAVQGTSGRFTSLSATTLSGGTVLSGATNLYSIFSQTDTVTRVQPGSNISTGGTDNLPTVNLVASPSVNNLTFSGSVIGPAISATTLSGGTIYSGGTNLYSIFAQPSSIPTRYDYDLVVAASNETTAITTGTSKVTFHAPRNFTLTGATASLTTTGSTSSVVDLNYEGSTVFSAPITLASGVYYNTSATTTSSISQYGKFTVDVDTAGTGAKGLKVTLLGYKSF